MAVDCTALGMPLKGENDIAQPLGAVVVIKGLDEDGKVAYWARSTDDLTSVEAGGMLLYGLEMLKRGFGGDPDDD